MLKLYNCLLVLCISTCLIAHNNTELLDYSTHSTEISNNFNPFKVNKELKISALGTNTSVMPSSRAINLATESTNDRRWRTPSDVNGNPDGVATDIFGQFSAGLESENLWTKEYGFNIPCNAVIDDLTVRITRRSEVTDIVDVNLSLQLPNFQPSAINLADNVTPWLISTTAFETVDYTHPNWGEVLTPEMINDPNFGVLYAIKNNDAFAEGTVALDAVEISVCYTVTNAYDTPISYTVTKTDACEGNGSITINAVGGQGSYQYSIDDGLTWETNNSFGGLDAGDYQLLVRSADGSCTTTVIYCALGADERILQPGDAIVTCAPTGSSLTTLAIESIQPLYDLYTAGEVGYDVSGTLPAHAREWDTADFGGSVFSVSIDNDYNIYTGVSSLYNIVGSATPKIVKIDGVSGSVSTLTILDGDKGVAGVEYDTLCNQIFTANLEDGIIYRIDPINGTTLSTYDPQTPFDGNYDGEFADIGDRVLAVTFNYGDGRLYYSMWNGDQAPTGVQNTVRSVAINPTTCDFVAGSDRLEVTTLWTNQYGDPDEVFNFNMPVTDIEFSQDGQTMLLAESGYDSSVPKSEAHESRYLRYTGTTNNWSLSTNLPAGNSFMEYEIGQEGNGLNSRGGVDFAAAGMLNNCTINNEEFIVGTGDALRGTTCFSYGCIYGFQFLPVSGGNPTNSVLVDVARDATSQQKNVYGDMDVVHGCRVAEFCGDYDLALNKNITSTGPYMAGSTVEFTITVINEGEVDAAGIEVTDNSPPDLTYVSMVADANVTDNGNETFTVGSLPVGSSQTIVVTYTIASNFMGTSIRNDAQITVDDGTDIDSDPNTGYDVDEDGDGDNDDDDEDGVSVLLVQVYDLALTKNITSAGPYAPGSTVEFTISVENEGSLNATGIVVTDDSPADLTFVSMTADPNVTDNGNETFTIASLAPNAIQDIVVTYMISNTYMGTTIRNDAQITVDDGDDTDSNPDTDYTVDENFDQDPDDDDEDGVDVPVGQVYDLALTKAISNTGPYMAGSTIEFTITVSNQGSVDANGIVVTDDSPADLTFVSMAANANLTDNGDETFTIGTIPSGGTQDVVVTYTISNTFMGTSLRNDAQITTDDGDDIDSNPNTDYTVDEDQDGNPDDDDEDGVDVPIGQIYDLSLTKTITSAGPYGPGDNVEFTINVSNDGSLNAAGIVVTDNSPADLTFVSMTADANVTDNGNETFTIGSIPAGTNQDVVVTYQISGTFMGTSLVNDAEITTDDGDDIDSDPDTGDDVDEDGDGNPDDDDEDEVTVPIGQVYDLSLTKAITSAGPYMAGSTVEFTITVSNDGTIDANGIQVTDSSPADLTYVSMAADANVVDNGGEVFTVTSLPAGTTQDIVVTYQISSAFMGTSLVNDAEITADDGDDIDSDPNTGDDVDEDGDGNPDDDDEDEVTVPVGQVYDLSLTKTVTSAGPYGSGDNVEFTITVSNDGSIDANGIQVTDSSPADLTFISMAADANVVDNGGEVFTVTSLPAGTTQDIVVTYQISSSFMGTSLVNDAEITADDGDDIDSDPDTGDDVDEDGDGNPDDDDEDEAIVPIGQVYDLSLNKAISSAGPYGPGDNVEFTITVSNDGTIDANAIEVSDSSPADLTFISMAADANVVDNGGEVFTVTSLPAGTTQDIVVTYQISSTFMGTSLINDAEITADDGDDIDSDPDTGDDVDEDGDGNPDDDDEDEVIVPIGQIYDLSLTKAVTSAGPFGPGDNVEFTITVSNDGTIDANAIEVSDSSPADLTFISMTADANVVDNGGEVFTVTSLPVGTTQDIVVTYQISSTFMGTSLVNDAEITADDGDDVDSDPDTGDDVDEDGDGNPDDDDEDEATVPVGQLYDLSLTKTITSAGPYSSGSTVTFDIEVTNEGTIDANGIEVTDAPSAGLTYVSMIADMNIVDNGGGVFTIGSIPANMSETIQVTYQVDASFMGTSLRNDAEITADDGDDVDSDPDTGNDVDEDGDGNPDDDDEDGLDIPVGQVYDLSLTKTLTSTGPYEAGSTLTFDVVVSNDGTIDANGIEVTDAPSAGLNYVSMLPNGNITDNGGGVFTITSIPAGTTETIELTYQIDNSFTGASLRNDAEITADDGDDIDSDPDTGNDVDEDGDGDPDDDDEDGLDIPVEQIYDLSLTKILTSAGPYEAGSILTFDIVVSNDGYIDANNIEVTDAPSAGLSYVSMVPNGNIVDNGGGVFTITSIPAGTTEKLELTYQIDSDFMGASLRNDAEITVDDGDDVDSDPDTGNDVDEDGDGDPDDDDEDGLDIPVDQVYDLSLEKTLVSQPPYAPGDTLDFEITVSNEGSIDASNIEVTDEAGASLIYVSSEASVNIVDNGGGVFTILNIPVGQSATIELSYQIDPDYAGDGLGNKAQITADDGDDVDSDPDTGDDVDEDGDGDPDDDDEDSVDFPVTIYDLALIVDLTSNAPHLLGGEATYTITVINQGNTDANNVEVVDYIPDGFALSPNDSNGWSGPLTGTTDTYSNTIPFIAAGTQETIDIILFIGDLPNGPDVSNWAEISADDGNDIDSTPDTINDDPYGGDNIVDNSNGDEDDHDDAAISVELGLVSVGDRVWNDLNGNGQQDNGEPGIENIVVKLFNGDGFLQDLVATDSNGNYLFDGLNSGTYYIEFELPEGFDPTLPYLGGDTDTDSNIDGSNGPGTTTKITLSPGENNLSIDAGIHECQPVGEYVWFDKNMNNTYDRDTENGINGLQVDLYRNLDGVWVFWDRDWTGIHPEKASDDGYFKFCAPPGEYYLDFNVPPTGMVPVTPGVGSERNDSDLDDGNGQYTTSTFTIVAGQENCDIGAGFYTMGSIGDIVWLDSNVDGVRSSNESPMSGVLVEAYDVHNDLVGSAVTDSDGRYMVDYLRQEDYYLKFYPPAGYTMTTPNAVLNDTKDSDVDHSNGDNTTGFYELGPAVHIPNVDAGMVVGVALPVDLTSFDGSYRQDYVYLDWETAAEINTDHFVIERRFHTEDDFRMIARQPANGVASKYNLNDYDVDDSGVYYYRLRTIDQDGSEEISKVISVDIESERSGDVSVYPNPAVNQINLDINLKGSRNVNVDIFNAAGQLIQAKVINQILPKGMYNAVVDISDLSAGVYNIMITKDSEVVSKKLIVLRN